MKKAETKVAEISVTYRPAIASKPMITTSLDAFTELIEFFPQETLALQERFAAMYLNRSNRVLGVYPLSVGGITGTIVDIRLLVSVALKTAATGIILAHNHPSGNRNPSNQDKEITRKIIMACALFDIKVWDHLIITPDRRFVSMKEEGCF